MIIVSGYHDELVGVLGLGRTGLSAVHALLAGNAKVVVWDDRPEVVESLRVLPHSARTISELILGQAVLNGRLIVCPDPAKYVPQLVGLLPSPGVPTVYPKPHPLIQLAKDNNIPLWSDIALLQHVCQKSSYIGVTGTNGKSTTTALIGHIYQSCNRRVQVGGNIGTPALELEPLETDGTYILELSSFQLEILTTACIGTSVLLNITPDHLDRYASIETYTEAKCNIFASQPEGAPAIISRDYAITRKVMDTLIAEKRHRVIPISTQAQVKNGVAIVNGVLYDHLEQLEQYALGKVPNLLGQHNAENMAAAYAACRINGLPGKEIIEAIRSFKGLPHRMQPVLQLPHLTFINDSKATNTDSTRKALETFDDIVWIAGGICKDNGIEELSDLFPKIKHAYLIGQAANQFAAILERYKVPYTIAVSLDKAIHLIAQANYKSGTVLLAPSCASYDQWRNFEERGTAFGEMVQQHFGHAAQNLT